MKPLILLLVFTVAALGQPIARPLDLSGVTEADIIATLQHMQRLVHEAEDKQASAEASASDLVVQLTAAGNETEKVQAKLDENDATIAALKKKLSELQTFARVILGLVFAAGAFWMWRLTSHLAFPPPWGIIVRIALCVGAGSLAAGILWRLITGLL